MTDPIKFEYVNNSLTTMAQSRLISKLASYIKVPVKKMRECLDEDMLKNTGIISFPGLYSSFNSFYLADIPININTFLTEKAITKSRFLEEYIIFKSKLGSKGVLFVANTAPDFMVFDDYFPPAMEGVGAIYVHYPSLEIEDKLLLPIDTYLKLTYPSPYTTTWLNEV